MMVYAYSKYEYTFNENCISLCNGEVYKKFSTQCECVFFYALDVVKVLL